MDFVHCNAVLIEMYISFASLRMTPVAIRRPDKLPLERRAWFNGFGAGEKGD